MSRVPKRVAVASLGLALLTFPAMAQTIQTTPLGPSPNSQSNPPALPADPNAPQSTLPSTLPQAVAPPEVYVEAKGGRVRVLDKLTARTNDLDLKTGVARKAGQITVEMSDCRYPQDNPSSDAYAHLTITQPGVTKPIFNAWMIASSPALSALDNPRYDVWVLSCDLPPGAAAAAAKAASTNSGFGSGG